MEAPHPPNYFFSTGPGQEMGVMSTPINLHTLYYMALPTFKRIRKYHHFCGSGEGLGPTQPEKA